MVPPLRHGAKHYSTGTGHVEGDLRTEFPGP